MAAFFWSCVTALAFSFFLLTMRGWGKALALGKYWTHALSRDPVLAIGPTKQCVADPIQPWLCCLQKTGALL